MKDSCSISASPGDVFTVRLGGSESAPHKLYESPLAKHLVELELLYTEMFECFQDTCRWRSDFTGRDEEVLKRVEAALVRDVIIRLSAMIGDARNPPAFPLLEYFKSLPVEGAVETLNVLKDIRDASIAHRAGRHGREGQFVIVMEATGRVGITLKHTHMLSFEQVGDALVRFLAHGCERLKTEVAEVNERLQAEVGLLTCEDILSLPDANLEVASFQSVRVPRPSDLRS